VSRDQGIKLGATPSDTETAPQRTPRRDLAASPCSGGNIQRVAHRPQHVARAHAALQDADAVHLAVQRVPVQRISGDTAQAAHDQVITEAPVAIVVNGISHAVMMATPCDLDDFARGFALSEGLIARPEELLDIDSVASPSGIELHLRVSARAEAALKATRRAMAGRTGCGLCGIESLQALQARHPVKAAATPSATTHGTPAAAIQPASDVSETSWDPIAPQALAAAFRQLASWQALHADTGGCHAAAWADAEGHIQAVREDVGRHNALDKLIGHLAASRALAQPGFVLMSSRASYELVSKCARVGLGTLATVSAPTSLAIELAAQTGVQLYGFCRGDTAVHYTPRQARSPHRQGLGEQALQPVARGRV
jgi:FdhD protein